MWVFDGAEWTEEGSRDKARVESMLIDINRFVPELQVIEVVHVPELQVVEVVQTPKQNQKQKHVTPQTQP